MLHLDIDTIMSKEQYWNICIQMQASGYKNEHDFSIICFNYVFSSCLSKDILTGPKKLFV